MLDITYNRWGDEIPPELSLADIVEVKATPEPQDDYWQDTFTLRRTVEAYYRAGIYSAPVALDLIYKKLDLKPRPFEDCPLFREFLGELFAVQRGLRRVQKPSQAVLSLIPYLGTPEAYTGRLEAPGYRAFGGAI